MRNHQVSRRAFLKNGALTTIGLAAGCVAPAPTEDEPGDRAPTATPLLTSTATPQPTATATAPPTLTSTASPTQPAATATARPTLTVTPQPIATERTQPTSTPTPSPTATPTLPATNTVAATAAPLVVSPSRNELIAHYPQAGQSVVSVVQHDGVWENDRIQQAVVQQMLDAAIVQLTGIGDALAAWRVLFDPGEIVGIKVNTISRYATSPEVTYAVAGRLQDAGIPAEQIILFDRRSWELIDRGYTINEDGPGVRCREAKGWEQPTNVGGVTQRFHDTVLSCHALINIPALKEHNISGFTSALKNHYGTIDRPGQAHGNHCDPYIAELNAVPFIQDKTRLVVGDWIRTCPYDWNRMTRENLIAMSFDPVAHDTVGRQVLLDRREADGRPGQYIEGLSHYLGTAVALGLGADEDHIVVQKRQLG